MPFPVAAAIGAGADLFSSLLNFSGTRAAANRAFDNALFMYDRQRSDALADRAFENEYNSPAAQMKRLKEANLNPNLIYGNGAGTAISSSVNTRQSQANNPPVPVPQIDLGSAVRTFMQIQQLQANTDNLKAQHDLIQENTKLATANTALREAQNILTGQQTQTSSSQMRLLDQQVEQATKSMPMTLEQLKLNNAKTIAENEKIKADTQFTLNQDERNAASQAMNFREALERILNMRQERAKSKEEVENLKQVRENLAQDNRIKRLDEYLASIGLEKNTGTFFKIIEQALENVGLKGFQNNPQGVYNWKKVDK